MHAFSWFFITEKNEEVLSINIPIPYTHTYMYIYILNQIGLSCGTREVGRCTSQAHCWMWTRRRTLRWQCGHVAHTAADLGFNTRWRSCPFLFSCTMIIKCLLN